MNALATDLPIPIYSASQVRELDRTAIEDFGIAGYELMCRAGQAALDAIAKYWPDKRSLVIYCGAGNNAGDGYVLARLAARAGYSVTIRAVTDPDRLTGDAAIAWTEAQEAAFNIEPYWRDGGDGAIDGEIVADALLGTGLDRELGGRYAEVVEEINAAGVPVLALDIPTGINADTGEVMGTAVAATVTVTFVGLKLGLFLGVAPDYCGEIEYSGLAIPVQAFAGTRPRLQRLSETDMLAALPRRQRTAHKGTHGRLLLAGGGPGMGGAIRLAAEAALRAGAGLVYVATHPSNIATVMSGRPEIICRGIETGAGLDLELAVDAIVLGPGLGRSEWAETVWSAVMDREVPLVVDADGLNILAERQVEHGDWLLTPHPGEAARLLGSTVAEVESDRLSAVAQLAERYQATVVLKGANTLVATAGKESSAFVCSDGNPGMATAGMGDVLSGVLGALVVQTRDPGLSARAGVLLHALAGDAAANEYGERGLVASDLMMHLHRLANAR